MTDGNKPQVIRLDYLDSVRGIAAMMVVIYHFIGWHWGDHTSYHLASIVFNGADAVSFFFVLSGFVLSYKYFHFDRDIHIKKYVFNRIMRLYPAFIITVILNYFYWMRDETFLHTLWDMTLNFNKDLWTELVMVRNQHKYYIPGWTLGVEMALSLLMPFLIIVVKNHRRFLIWMIPLFFYIGPGYINTFSVHFALGILLSYYYQDIVNYDFKASKYYPYRWGIAVLTFILYSIRHIERIVDFGSGYDRVAGFLKIDLFHYTGFASFVILLYIINNKTVQSWLNKTAFTFLGKISYSVYLMHWLIVVYIMERWPKWVELFGSTELAFGCMLVLTILLTLISATFMYYYVEKPMIKWSKKKSSAFK